MDDLFTSVSEDPDWSIGLKRFDDNLAELRRKHAAGLPGPEDREASERHAGQFGAMQRIGLKRALVERQQADALSQLDEQLAYYASKAATAPNDVFRSIAVAVPGQNPGIPVEHDKIYAVYPPYDLR